MRAKKQHDQRQSPHESSKVSSKFIDVHISNRDKDRAMPRKKMSAPFLGLCIRCRKDKKDSQEKSAKRVEEKWTTMKEFARRCQVTAGIDIMHGFKTLEYQ